LAIKIKDPGAMALALFDSYVEMPYAGLSKALSELQREDADVCAELMRLLAADEQTHSFASPLQWLTAQGDNDSMSDDIQIKDRIWPDGTRLGPWCVDGIIGLGGMGVIYAAHRADGLYEREVALKTIRAELMSPALQQAFAKERSHLAKLEHPSIVALYDAGITDNGQPWLAMQRVHGDSIDCWCDAHKLDLRGRVRLLVEACDAIAYAHAHGVLHQDIKTSNLLVTEDGKVKLLDFGLSALSVPNEDSVFTRIGVSSAYAAPEIFEGAPPSVAIDVYALGVVLYRLLCAGWPRTPRMMTALRDAHNDTARCPSVLAINDSREAAQVRGLEDIKSLSQAISGDLDAIALRCVEQNPVDRYASVTEISTDLRAWSERRPVGASNGGLSYRATRFVRRNALAVTVVAMLGLVSAGAGWVSLKQQQRARIEAENGEILNQLFENSIGAAALSSLGSAPLSSQALLNDAERKLRTAAGTERPQFLARGLDALARAYLVRGDYLRTEGLLNESKTLGVGNALQVAKTDAVLAQLFNLQGKSERAERVVREGLAMLPPRRNVQDDLVELDLQMQLAKSRWGNGDPFGSIRILDAAINKALALGDSGVPALCELLGQRGYVYSNLYRTDAAEKDLMRALALIGDRSSSVRNTILLYLTHYFIDSGNPAKAHTFASTLLVDSLKTYGPSHPETGRAWIAAGKSWFTADDIRRSRIALDQGEMILGRNVGPYHPDMVTAALIRSGIGFSNGDLEYARAQASLALKIADRAYGSRHEVTLRRMVNLAAVNIFLAKGAKSSEQDAFYAKADALLAKAISIGEQQKLPMWYAYGQYAMVLLHFHRIDEAERQVLRGLNESEKLLGKTNSFRGAYLIMLLKVRTSQKRHDDAAKIGLELISMMEADEKPDYTHYVILEAVLDNEIARDDQERIRAAYRRLREFSRKNGFLALFDAKKVAGISDPP
jgi:eukaryotic-like serine/threonine-protein kinase